MCHPTQLVRRIPRRRPEPFAGLEAALAAWSFVDQPAGARRRHQVVAAISNLAGLLTGGVWSPGRYLRSLRSRTLTVVRGGSVLVEPAWYRQDQDGWTGPSRAKARADLRLHFQSFDYQVDLAGSVLLSLVEVTEETARDDVPSAGCYVAAVMTRTGPLELAAGLQDLGVLGVLANWSPAESLHR